MMKENVREVSLTGSIVKDIMFHNGVAIIDTNNNDSDILDVSMLKDKTLKIINLLNQSVDITIYAFTGFNSSYSFSLGTKTVGTSIAVLFSDTDFPNFSKPISRIKIRAKCSVAPTSGSLTTIIEGGIR